MKVELLNNAEFGRLIGAGSSSHRCRHIMTGIEFNLSFAGLRNDHYDCTPTTPSDMEAMRKANGGRLTWLAMPVLMIIGNRMIAGGMHTFMHGSRIGGGNPGANFPSRSNTPPFSTPNGGHVCLYLQNSVGGTTSATTLPAANNSNARPLANERAGTPHARGRQSRAACHEAYILGNERFNNGIVPPLQPVQQTHTVMLGDSLSKIGRDTGRRWQDIAKLNNITEPYTIHPGQVLRLP